MTDTDSLRRLAAARWKVTFGLTAVMIVLYFGFILLVAWGKPLLAIVLVPGLSVGILLGALLIVLAWALMIIYTRWANRHHDDAVVLERGNQ